MQHGKDIFSELNNDKMTCQDVNSYFCLNSVLTNFMNLKGVASEEDEDSLKLKDFSYCVIYQH